MPKLIKFKIDKKIVKILKKIIFFRSSLGIFTIVFVLTRKYPLRGYILGPPGWPESIFSAGLGLTFFSFRHFGKVSTQLLGSRQGSACVDHPTVKIEYT